MECEDICRVVTVLLLIILYYCVVILGMLASHAAVNSALNDDKLLSDTDIETRVEKIPKKIVDDTINIFRVKKYFSNSAWKIIQSLLK